MNYRELTFTSFSKPVEIMPAGITKTLSGEHSLQNYQRYYTTVFTGWTGQVMKYQLNLWMLLHLVFLFSPGSECGRSMLLAPVPWAHPPGSSKRYRQPLTHTHLTSPCCLLHRPACASVGRYWNTHRCTLHCMQHLTPTLPIYTCQTVLIWLVEIWVVSFLRF